MNITNDMRLAALRKSSEGLQELYGSLETAQLIGHIRREYGIGNDSFVDLIGDIMLGFYPKSDLRKLLVSMFGLSEEVSEHIERDLRGLLVKIDGVPVVPVAPREIKERLDLRPPIEAQPVNGMPGHVKPLTREDVLRAITPKRTMAGDIEQVRQEGKDPR